MGIKLQTTYLSVHRTTRDGIRFRILLREYYGNIYYALDRSARARKWNEANDRNPIH